jgi:TetR/AcrR family transcriptional regulator, regulator of cefoperazone and chloramphenicol sensitivity
VKADAETRARLLATAERLFGERGFKVVTVREICKAARANVAAVNYHFGDKLGLYREVLQGATDAMRETSEAARQAGEGQPPEEQLRRFIGVFLHRVLAPGRASIHRIITREINDPTPALDLLVEQGVRPRVEYLSGVIAGILGCDPRDTRVLRCVGSVQSQVVSYFPNPIAARLGFSFEPTRENIEDAARHIATFSLAGVKAVGRPARSRPATRGVRPRPVRAVRTASR